MGLKNRKPLIFDVLFRSGDLLLLMIPGYGQESQNNPQSRDEEGFRDDRRVWRRVTDVAGSTSVRSLDGSNGEITWDRSDPVRGLLPRPSQRIGAIRVGLDGGANTFYNGKSMSGIVFTGLAMGNSQEDSPDENHIRIPLRGREAKLDGDGDCSDQSHLISSVWDH